MIAQEVSGIVFCDLAGRHSKDEQDGGALVDLQALAMDQ
ncbi:hypothetical protein QO002_001970 [Pararhizobium capsulatum DSM 1112]|uniref:Uncharacterized protein n=1 Tax=Pararhizobium capsulatum DSM 1112 TaxID=1121113 RepID=A0ABU0BPE0_9HYPH|nr:hypothetical protein [Pararhizobium capsulatum DSM 1112]